MHRLLFIVLAHRLGEIPRGEERLVLAALRSGLIGWLVGSATQVASAEAMWVSWPKGDTGAVMIFSEMSLLAMLATS